MRSRWLFQVVITLMVGAAINARAGRPGNDFCADAQPVTLGTVAAGTTVGSTPDAAPFCGTSNSSAGVWFSVVGNGNTLTASTCGIVGTPPGTADYDSKLSVFCESCATPTCVGGNDDATGCGLKSAVSWCSEDGATYRILVHGFGVETGTFSLGVSSDSTACTGAVSCSPASRGACCDYGELLESTVYCSETNEAACADAGDVFHGLGTACNGSPDTTFNANSICADDDFFSTTTSHYAVSTLVEQQVAYSVSLAGPPIQQFARFLTPYQGLDALDVLSDWTLIFSPYLTPASNPSGWRHENAYHYHPLTQQSHLVLDGRALGLRSLDAIDRLADGSFAFSTASDQPLGSLFLRDENVYRFIPPSTVELFFDGQAIGLLSLDALDVLLDGSVVFSTASGQFLRTSTGVVFLQDRNAYLWEPSGTVSLAFNGLSIGIVNLDALSLARGIEPETMPCN